MRRAIIAQAVFFASALLWAALIAERSPLEGGSGAMVAVSVVALATVAVVGTLVVGGRWARRLTTTTSVALLALAPFVEAPSWLWTLAVVVSAYALAESIGTGLSAVVRRLPSASGPPVQALLIPLVALGWPGLLALVQTSGVNAWDWWAAGSMIGAGFWYARALPAALWVIRIGVPLLGLIALAVAPLPGWLLPGAGAGVITYLAWTKPARIAVQPLVERGRPVPIPPELTPTEILDAAGLDDRGRKQR